MSLATLGALCATAFFVVAFLLALDNDPKVEHDSAIYITLAKSLVSGQGYRDIFLVGDPPHTKYPPVFPVILAPLVYLLGYHFVAMKLLVVAFALGALYLLYAFLKELSDALTASLVVIATATSHGLLYYSASIMTEMPYLLFSLLALRWLHHRGSRKVWDKRSIATVVTLIAIVYLTRLIGLSLVLAAVAYVLFDGDGGLKSRMKRALVLGAVVTIPAIIWFLHNWSVGESSGTAYAVEYYHRPTASTTSWAMIQVLASRLIVNLYKYALHSARVIFFYLPSVSQTLLLAPVAGLICGGFLWRVARQRTLLEYYVSFYMLGLLLFPASRPQRYLVPLIPFIWFYFLIAVRQVTLRLGRHMPHFWSAQQRRVVLATQLVFLALVVSNATAAILLNVVHRGGKEGYYHVSGEDGYVHVTRWANIHTPPDSVFVWAKPALRFLWTERKGTNYATAQNIRQMRQLMQLRRVDYVVVDDFSERTRDFLRSLVENDPNHFSLVHSNDVSQVYQVMKAR